MSPASQIRPLIARDRKLYIAIFGKELGAQVQHGDEEDDRWKRLEEDRERKWQALRRELKLAVKRIHVNLGHANIPTMLRALRVSKASEAALRAVRLFRCMGCPRIQNPKEPRPSKMPITDEFNVQIGLDIIHENDSSGQPWSWLNIFCQGTQFQVCVLLDSAGQPTGQQVVEAFGLGWTNWAGFPERGVVADRANLFLQPCQMRLQTMVALLAQQPKLPHGRSVRSKGMEVCGKKLSEELFGRIKFPDGKMSS